MSRLMGKPTVCMCENKDADQLRGTREADQRLCFRYSDTTIPPLLNSQNFKLLACFCDCTGRFVSDLFGNHIVGFPTRRLICFSSKLFWQYYENTGLLAHLSRRLTGELIVYPCSGVRPSSVRRPQFQRSSSLKPLGRSS